MLNKVIPIVVRETLCLLKIKNTLRFLLGEILLHASSQLSQSGFQTWTLQVKVYFLA